MLFRSLYQIKPMVKSLIGKANDFELIFEHVSGEEWQAATPPDAYGQYAIELWATDEAGNVSYMASMLYLVSRYTLQGYLIPAEYSGLVKTDELIAMLDSFGLAAAIAKLKEMKGGVQDGISKS